MKKMSMKMKKIGKQNPLESSERAAAGKEDDYDDVGYDQNDDD